MFHKQKKHLILWISFVAVVSLHPTDHQSIKFEILGLFIVSDIQLDFKDVYEEYFWLLIVQKIYIHVFTLRKFM